MYISLKQCGERLPLVVMFTITFIQYMMIVIYYVSEAHSCARQSKTTNFFSKRSRGYRPVHESTPPRQVLDWCQTKCSKFEYILHNHELTIFIHNHICILISLPMHIIVTCLLIICPTPH